MVNCPICDQNDDFMLLKKDGEFEVLKCTKCGSIYSNFETQNNDSRISMPDINDYIKMGPFNFPSFLLNRYMSKLIANFDLKYLKKHVNLKSIKVALDIGSKYGYMIKNLLIHGIDVSGIEAQQYQGTISKNKISYQYFDDKYDSKGLKYDLITMGDVLYENKNGINLLKKAMRILNNGGFLLVTGFNPDSSLINDVINIHGIAPILYISEKAYEKICNENNCTLLDFCCYEPKLFVMKINISSKIRALISLVRCIMKIDDGFEPKSEGLRTYALIKK